MSAIFLFPLVAGAASPGWLTAHDAEIKEVVGRMTLAEKVGQMTQPDVASVRDFSDIETFFLGSILSGGGSDPKTGNTLKDWAALYESCQARALKTRLAIPLLYGIDAVHGHNNVLGAVVFPHNIGLGCTRNPALVKKAAQITAREVRATGIQWTFAPCVTVPRDLRWGRTYEGFSEDPSVVAPLGRAAVLGFQGKSLSGRAAVLACAKHFLGDGGTTYQQRGGSAGMLDQGDTRVDEAVLRSIHLAGYPAAIDAGVGTIMPSYSSWNGVKCSGSKFLLTDLLKKELGFEGFLISDYNAIDQLVPSARSAGALDSNNAAGQGKTENYKKCIEISINAGMDMVMVTTRYREFISLLQELVKEGKIPMERIDDAVTRILRVKFAQGLMRKGAVLMADASLQKEFGSEAHRAVAREAVQKSVVLLKNEGRVLPLSRKAKRIHVTGRGADDIGMQCGGWTIDWQGKRGAVTTGGTTILTALRQAAGKGTAITGSKESADARGADVAVVVIGEEPYAEMNGDRSDLALSREDAAAVSEAKAAGVPVVVVVLSGRPLVLGDAAGQADAILAAWLPGTEGQGVADVLFGDVSPTGKLSFTWPHSMDQLPLGHVKARSENAQFPFGFGLEY
ncbi:MAG: glycoside hydrolase family 3 N-terminal domain-containing protein [Verrucomicrobiae bacterium]